MALDISPYLEQILAEADKPLFKDAVKSAKAGAMRGAYVLIWLSCAESFKRRFNEAQRRDGAAGRIVGQINSKESNHQATDKYILTKSKEYGFISDPEHNILNHIYEMRCIYGHPYEQEPSKEQVIHAAQAVVSIVLSRSVKLRNGFASKILKKIFEDQNYLDDTRMAVVSFSKDILNRIDETIYDWYLEQIWVELEKIVDDPTMKLFYKRGKWLSQTLIEKADNGFYSAEQWHESVGKFPNTSYSVLSKSTIFKDIGKRAQDSLVGIIISRSDEHPTSLRILEILKDKGVLSSRQIKRFQKKIKDSKITLLKSSGLSTLTCIDKIISSLGSHDWYIQNPAAEFLTSNGAEGICLLDGGQQEELGRNILQAAEGDSNSSTHFLARLTEDIDSWPNDLLKGIALECFVNEKQKIRFKEKQLKYVLEALDELEDDERTSILDEIEENITKGEFKYSYYDENDLDNIETYTTSYEWLEPILETLKNKFEEVSDEE